MIERVIRLFVYILLCLFPLGELLRVKLYENVYIVPQDIVVMFIFILSLVFFLCNKKSFIKSRFIKYQFVFEIKLEFVNSYQKH